MVGNRRNHKIDLFLLLSKKNYIVFYPSKYFNFLFRIIFLIEHLKEVA